MWYNQIQKAYWGQSRNKGMNLHFFMYLPIAGEVRKEEIALGQMSEFEKLVIRPGLSIGTYTWIVVEL